MVIVFMVIGFMVIVFMVIVFMVIVFMVIVFMVIVFMVIVFMVIGEGKDLCTREKMFRNDQPYRAGDCILFVAMTFN